MKTSEKTMFYPASAVEFPASFFRDSRLILPPGSRLYSRPRVFFAALLSVSFLLMADVLGRHLPVWLSQLEVPSALSGGEFIAAGLLLGVLLAICAVICLTALFYLAFWLYAEMTHRPDAA